ncbi:MAG: ROK family protein [Phycisphaeraceae bacterium]|nr:ROK family protein [Phycisphaeraceae bacterium]
MTQQYSIPTLLPPRLAHELSIVRQAGQCSRSDLHRQMDCRKNTIGQDVATLIQMGLLREGALHVKPRGRPSVHLEIDPQQRHVLGLSITPGQVNCERYNLLGQAMGTAKNVSASDPSTLIPTARKLLKKMITPQTLFTGLAIPGTLDLSDRKILFSSAWPDGKQVSLKPLDKVTDGLLAIDNLTNALATRWLLEHATWPKNDHLIIFISDGMLGATLLVDGHPLKGCVVSSNELGHTRLPVRTPLCYCGQEGCLERIFSTPYYKQLGGKGKLTTALTKHEHCEALGQMTEHLAMGLSNAVNFCRPTHVTLMTDLPAIEPYMDHLIQQIRNRLLREFANRVQMHLWTEPQPQPAANGAALALAHLYFPNVSDS